jgi:FMN reductase
MRLLAIDGSPAGGGRTEVVLRAILEGSRGAGADQTDVLSLAERDVRGMAEVVQRLEQADGFVFGSPVYRATYAWPLKLLLDHLPRGMWGEPTAPLRGKPVAIAMTGASLHHFLALNDLRGVLSVFFAAHVLPPGVYVPREGFADEPGAALQAPYAAQAELTGRALVESAEALARSTALRLLEPQA